MSESFVQLPPLPATPNLDVDASMQLSPGLSSQCFDLGDIGAWQPNALTSVGGSKQDARGAQMSPSLQVGVTNATGTLPLPARSGSASSVGSTLEAPRANSGTALERSRINSAERKFRGRASSPNPRTHPFQRPSGGDALNRGRAQTYDALGASLGGSSLNRSRTNTFDGLNRSRTNTFDGGLAPPSPASSLDFRQRTNSTPAAGAFAHGAARSAPHPRVPSATIEMYNSPSADEDLAILFQVLDVRAPRSLHVPLKNRDLPASFFGSATPQKGAFGGSVGSAASAGMAPQLGRAPPVATQIAAMELGAIPNIDHIFSAPTAVAGSTALPKLPPDSSTLPEPPPGLQVQKGATAETVGVSPPIDIMDILDSGALETELSLLGVQTGQAPQSAAASAVPDVADGILDDLDLDF